MIQEISSETTNLNEIAAFRKTHSSQKIGVTASCFDLLHAGHHIMLKDGKEHCDIFVAFLQTDPTVDRPTKNKPIMSFNERFILLDSCKYVDKIFIYTTEQELYDGLKTLNADIRILGDDYIGKNFTGSDLAKEVYYHPRSNHEFSSTSLRRRIYEIEKAKFEKNNTN